MHKKLLPYAKIAHSLLRKATYLLLLLYLVIGYLAGLLLHPAAADGMAAIHEISSLVLCGLVIAFWYINGSGLNDYADYEIDKINLKGDHERPLVSGAASKQTLMQVVIAGGIASAVLAALVSWQHLIVAVCLLFLNVTYSIRPFQISRRGGVAPLLLPLGYIVLPFYLGYLLHGHDVLNPAFVLLIAAFYAHFIGRIILKDYRDVKGDKKHGKQTFLLKHGNSSVTIVSGIAILISTVLLFISLDEYLGYIKYGLIFLTFFGLVILHELSQRQVWNEQKPLLAAFGRSMTGVTALVIVTLIDGIWNLSDTEQLCMVVVILGIYTWSASQAYQYNHAVLNKQPKAKP